MVALLINTSPVTSSTKNDIDISPVPVLASDDSASPTFHLIQNWSMQFLLKQLLDSTTFTDHTNNCQTHSIITTIQFKQPALDSYYPYTDGLFAFNPTMNIHYHVIKHSQLLLN